MITKRAADERGHANHGWLDTYHTFSFGSYFDPNHTGFRSLRVINDDTVAPGAGFGTHRHDNMEIVSYVLDGALEHKDGMGTGSVLRPGDVQRMSAGRGVSHSEFNHSADAPLRFLQIWLLPTERDIEPGYEEKHFSDDERTNQLRLIVSPDGRDDSMCIHQDADIYASLLDGDRQIQFDLRQPDRHAWLQVASGRIRLNGIELSRGDGAAVTNETSLTVEGVSPSEFLLFDLS